MGFSKYRRSHTVIIFIILMDEKSVSISVYIENKTTKIRLSPCVHITFCTVVTFRYLWMLTSYVTGGCCHISVVSECYGSPLKYSHNIYVNWPHLTYFGLHGINGSQLANWKRVFLACPCHEIYKDEAVGLKSCKYTWKITIYVNMWNLGQFREILIFCQ